MSGYVYQISIFGKFIDQKYFFENNLNLKPTVFYTFYAKINISL